MKSGFNAMKKIALIFVALFIVTASAGLAMTVRLDGVLVYGSAPDRVRLDGVLIDSSSSWTYELLYDSTVDQLFDSSLEPLNAKV